MGTENDPQYPPLLAPGFHDLRVEDLEPLLVDGFQERGRRSYILSRLKALLGIIEAWRVPATVWLNGSFVTEKEEPDDVDVVVLIKTSELKKKTDQVTLEIKTILITNRDETKIRYCSDAYYCNPDDFNQKAYWRGVFGFDREDNPKGICRLRMGAL